MSYEMDLLDKVNRIKANNLDDLKDILKAIIANFDKKMEVANDRIYDLESKMPIGDQ